jgi:hypothetical protein
MRATSSGPSQVELQAHVVAAMKEVAREGLRVARHLRGDIWEVRVAADTKAFRVLFSPEGESQQVLLALEAFRKKTQKTPSCLRAPDGRASRQSQRKSMESLQKWRPQTSLRSPPEPIETHKLSDYCISY